LLAEKHLKSESLSRPTKGCVLSLDKLFKILDIINYKQENR